MISETVPQVFKEAVLKYADRVAMRKKDYGLWHDISWNEYYQKAKCVGAALISMGLEKGDRVCIIGDNCPEWIFASMGIQCSGAFFRRLKTDFHQFIKSHHGRILKLSEAFCIPHDYFL